MSMKFSNEYNTEAVAWLWDGNRGQYVYDCSIGRLKDIRSIIGSFAQNYKHDTNKEFIHCTIEILKSNIPNVKNGKRFKFRLYSDGKFAIRNN